jgi:hypothetical protein
MQPCWPERTRGCNILLRFTEMYVHVHIDTTKVYLIPRGFQGVSRHDLHSAASSSGVFLDS